MIAGLDFTGKDFFRQRNTHLSHFLTEVTFYTFGFNAYLYLCSINCRKGLLTGFFDDIISLIRCRSN